MVWYGQFRYAKNGGLLQHVMSFASSAAEKNIEISPLRSVKKQFTISVDNFVNNRWTKAEYAHSMGLMFITLKK